ncbi:low molecular weight protein arginine phosphatase [Thalassorhabdus alkalitolerans]|uniref:Low molecular weight protein arginine phosphatase n=1 Tax=Thalassorhabdus alkalitolerans TaxID=2282697 RepID=A0ABW0YGG0_9BACI|nr:MULTISPECIES: low molecular weight protein arginine phosphatase [Bacillaceae]
MKKILFVCTGNTCRSPMAEALMKKKAGEQVEIKSAGVHAFPGMGASEGTTSVLNEREIPLNHSARLVDRELVEWADLILTMTKSHFQLLAAKFPAAAEKAFTIKEFANDENHGDISDPIGGTIEDYRNTARELDALLDKVIQKLD